MTEHKRHRSRPSAAAAATAILAITSLSTTSTAITVADAALVTLPSFQTITHSKRGTRIYRATQLRSSVGLTLDGDAEPSRGLWKMRKSNNNNDRTNNRSKRDSKMNQKGRRDLSVVEQLVPFGPVPRGGSLSDIVILPSAAASATVALKHRQQQHPHVQNNSGNPIVNTWSSVRSGVRGARRRLVCAANMTVLRGVSARGAVEDMAKNQRQQQRRLAIGNVIPTNTLKETGAVGGSDGGPMKINGSILRVGGRINRRLLRRRRAARTARTGAVSDTAVLATQLESSTEFEVDAWSNMEMAMNDVVSVQKNNLAAVEASSIASASATSSSVAIEAADKSESQSLPFVGRLFQRRNIQQNYQKKEQLQKGVEHQLISAAYETASSMDALSSRGGDVATATASVSSSSVSSTSIETTSEVNSNMMDTYVIETPLFPIILPKAFEPPSAARATSTEATAASSVTSLEISVAIQEEVTTSTADEATTGVGISKPSSQLLAAATSPLLPKASLDSFTGTELYYPESMEALCKTGLAMTLGQGMNEYVDWAGEKKTDKFLKEHGQTINQPEWYEALDSTQEVLVWAGKFITGNEYYGAELPIIKTTSIIHQSPKYLAELLMDSSKVQVYNKMSLGRTDEEVFQTGVDTQGGSFGDGESKVVRNLTKPPMVSSLIEFVTCMHARKLGPADMKILSPNNSNNAEDGSSIPAEEGYIVVSRAVTGGKWSTGNATSKSNSGEKLVRNEILLGVNILKSVPGQPNKTELTSVTHVYSPMIPLMLAKNAGVKGAVDFVRDIRALP